MTSSTATRPHRVYVLRSEYAGIIEQVEEDGSTVEVPCFTGGLLTANGEDFDVRAALDEGDGEIRVDSTNYVLIAALDEYPALECVGEEDGEVEVAPVLADDLSDADPDALGRNRTKGELIAAAESRGLDKTGNRAELAERIVAHDIEAVSGDNPDNPDAVAEGDGENPEA